MGRMGRTYTIRGEGYTVIGEVPFDDGRIQFELRKASDNTVWTTVGKGLTPRAHLVAAGTDSEASNATPTADGQCYVEMIRDALKVSDYMAALTACDEGSRMAPDFPVMLGDKPSTWARSRAAIVGMAAERGVSVPAEPTSVSVQQPAPTSVSAPVPVRPATPVATESGKRVQVATIAHGAGGTFLAGTPFPLRFKVAAAISSKSGGCWTWDKARKAWNLDGSAGCGPDMERINACVAKMAEIDIPVIVDLNAPVPAAKGTATAGQVTVTRKPVAPVAETKPEAVTPTVADPGPAIAGVLAARGFSADVIASAVDAARKAAGFHGTPTDVPASPVAPKVTVKASPVPAVKSAAAPVGPSDGGTRDYALPLGTPVRRSAKALQDALSGEGHAFTVTVVKTDPGKPNLLCVSGSGDWVAVDRHAASVSATASVPA